MPKTKSAKKALSVSKRRKEYNLKIKEEIKRLIKKIRKERKKEDLKKVTSLFDKAVIKGVIHKNKAGRLKSRLARELKKEPKVIKTEKKQRSKRKKSLKKK